MLDIAYKYKDKLQDKYLNIFKDLNRYKFWMCSTYIDYNKLTFKDNDEWFHIRRVSIINNDIIAYYDANISRPENYINALSILSFKKSSSVVIKDLIAFIEQLFYVYNFYKIEWSVVDGNPAKRIYDKFIKKYNGRIVGIFKKHIMLSDGQLYDTIMYEIFKDDYDEIKNQNKRLKIEF